MTRKKKTYGIPASSEAEQEGAEIVKRLERAEEMHDEAAIQKAERDLRRWSRQNRRIGQQDFPYPQAYFPYTERRISGIKRYLERIGRMWEKDPETMKRLWDEAGP